MANIIGILTINQTRFLELDGSPLPGGVSGVEIGDFCLVDGQAGIYQKTGPNDADFVRVDAWTAFSKHTVQAGSLALGPDSSTVWVFEGSTAGQIVTLPVSNTVILGYQFLFINDSSQNITIKDSAGSSVLSLRAGNRAHLVLKSKATSAGSWSVSGISKTKAGTVSSGSFSGTPKKATITFSYAYADTDYGVRITGEDARTWTIESKTNTGFVINANADQALTGNVYWEAVTNGEVI